ncbi:MAG TPA: P-II family nitrogen regulator [Bacillota bacterium]|nr:P-II family nitrogen regulator [Bacillota bacterium]
MNFTNYFSLELICIVVNNGIGRKIAKFSKTLGVSGSTVCLGKGTVKPSKLLEFFDLVQTEKEVILIINDSFSTKSVLEGLNEKFKFAKPNHGIAFSIPVKQLIGSNFVEPKVLDEEVKQTMYNAIFTIINKGKSDQVIDAARSAGANGGTIINARGSGNHETEKLFNLEITPEKEIILILCKNEITNKVVNSIREKLNIDEPGNGIVFVQDVNYTYGLVDQTKKE